MLHTALSGKLEVREDGDKCFVTIDGFNVMDELTLMAGMEVQFDVVAYERSTAEAPPSVTSSPAEDIIKKLMGGDGPAS